MKAKNEINDITVEQLKSETGHCLYQNEINFNTKKVKEVRDFMDRIYKYIK